MISLKRKSLRRNTLSQSYKNKNNRKSKNSQKSKRKFLKYLVLILKRRLQTQFLQSLVRNSFGIWNLPTMELANGRKKFMFIGSLRDSTMKFSKLAVLLQESLEILLLVLKLTTEILFSFINSDSDTVTVGKGLNSSVPSLDLKLIHDKKNLLKNWRIWLKSLKNKLSMPANL